MSGVLLPDGSAAVTTVRYPPRSGPNPPVPPWWPGGAGTRRPMDRLVPTVRFLGLGALPPTHGVIACRAVGTARDADPVALGQVRRLVRRHGWAVGSGRRQATFAVAVEGVWAAAPPCTMTAATCLAAVLPADRCG